MNAVRQPTFNNDPTNVDDPYMKTRSGAVLTFADPQVEQIKTQDIFWAICNTARFTGHTALMVGQHVLEVSQFVYREFAPDDPQRLDAALVGLAHDFHEAYVGDVSSPLKTVIRGEFRSIDNRFSGVIHKRYGLEKAREQHHISVRRNDMRCLYEDAIRFGMDGVKRDFFIGDDIQIERLWVPKDFNSVLQPIILSPRDCELLLWRSFTALMVESGRGALI